VPIERKRKKKEKNNNGGEGGCIGVVTWKYHFHQWIKEENRLNNNQELIFTPLGFAYVYFI